MHLAITNLYLLSLLVYFLTPERKFGAGPPEILTSKNIPLAPTFLFLLMSEKEVPFHSRLIPPSVPLGDILKTLPNSTSKFSTGCLPKGYKHKPFYFSIKIENKFSL